MSDKRYNCPFCIIPISSDKDAYKEHLLQCPNQMFDILQCRLQKWCHILVPQTSSNNLVSEYFEFISYDRSFFPDNWCDDVQENNTDFYNVERTSKEGQKIISHCKNAANIIRIERIQNKELYLKFMDFQAQNEGRDLLLFHGTRTKNYNLICNQGFDRGHSKNGSYGYGIYLSSCMRYSMAYNESSTHESRHQCMLVCRTRVTQDCKISDNIHVINDDFAVYPEYLLYLEV